jgi:glycosyltransferase involved in cell wall biosynthesis
MLGVNPHVMRYRAELAGKRTAARALSLLTPSSLSDYPRVTVFVINTSNRYPLEMTLRSLTKHTRYPNFQIWVADNASSDGSRAFLEEARSELPITRILTSDTRRLHAEWLDTAHAEVDTPYWFGVDEDMMFLGSDWLSEMMDRFVKDPDLYLLSGEHVPAQIDVVEPVSQERVDVGTMPSTWIFGVRTALREKLSTPFTFHRGPIDPTTQRRNVYDTGGKLLEDMRSQGLRYDHMPSSFRVKYHHVGHLSWVFRHDVPAPLRTFKQYQVADIEDRVLAGRW